MIRVLHINAGSGVFGGVSMMCLNWYRNIDKDKIQFEFLTPNKTTYSAYEDEINLDGGKIYELEINASSLIGKIKLWFALRKFFKSHRYDVIHVNSGVLLFNCAVVSAAKNFTDAVVFCHSHNNGGRSKYKEKFAWLLKSYISKKSDKLLAISDSAADYMFCKKSIRDVIIIKNGIVVDKFKYDSLCRDTLRKQLCLTDKFVIGHVGRFVQQKNHDFLIKLFHYIHSRYSNTVLLLIGEGPLYEQEKLLVAKLNLEDSVIFVGPKENVNDYYQAMDVFVLPSIYEGLGIVNIEAQTTGLKCVVSDIVPEMINVTGNVTFLSLKENYEIWEKEIMYSFIERKDQSDVVKNSGYDIKQSTKLLETLYINCVSAEQN